MARILIVGALDFSDVNVQIFVSSLASEVVEQGHVLLNGCLNEFDKLIAQNAYTKLIEKSVDPTTNLISYAIDDREPAHRFGTIRRSRLQNWELTFKRLHVPEPIHMADAVIIVGGSDGTMRAANWARIDKKPILPVTAFGGAAKEIYNEEIKDFEGSRYTEYITRDQFELLNQVSTDMGNVAKDVVSLAERLLSSKDVFVIMSFSDDPKLEDAYESFQEICKEYQYECSRVNNATLVERIVPEIFTRIKKAAFVIVDLTDERANVYYEFGFAQGTNKHVIVTAYKDTSLPFDVADIPVIFWEGQKQLKDKLRERIEAIASTQGRQLK